MKTYLVSLALLFLCAAVAGQPAPVLDDEGNEVQAGTKYYMVSTNILAGRGGLGLGRTGNKKCPFSVVQVPSNRSRGQPLTFHPFDSNGNVYTLTDLNIRFEVTTPCNSSVWTLANYDEPSGNYYVKIGGMLGQPGIGTLSNWFKIQRSYGDSYQLVFCPNVCDICNTSCKAVGIHMEENKKRLGLVEDGTIPFVFKIVKSSVSDDLELPHESCDDDM